MQRTWPVEIAPCCMAAYTPTHDEHHNHSDRLRGNPGNGAPQSESSADDSYYSSSSPTPALSHALLQASSPWLPRVALRQHTTYIADTVHQNAESKSIKRRTSPM